MKKVVLIAALLLGVVSSTVPAQSAAVVLGAGCTTYIGPSGNRAVEVCASVIWTGGQGNNTAFHSRLKINSVAGFTDPYKVKAIYVQFWNKSRNIGQAWCDGRAPACSGGGDIGPGVSTTTIPASFNTTDNANAQHFDLIHTEIQGTIEWTSGGSTTAFDNNNHYDSGGSYPGDDNNGNVASEPYCRAYNVADQSFCSF